MLGTTDVNRRVSHAFLLLSPSGSLNRQLFPKDYGGVGWEGGDGDKSGSEKGASNVGDTDENSVHLPPLPLTNRNHRRLYGPIWPLFFLWKSG